VELTILLFFFFVELTTLEFFLSVLEILLFAFAWDSLITFPALDPPEDFFLVVFDFLLDFLDMIFNSF
jgi:hypothetical protein